MRILVNLNKKSKVLLFIQRQMFQFLQILTLGVMLAGVTIPLTSQAYASSVNPDYLPFIKKSLMLDVSAVDGLVAVVGERGFILLSTDSGKSWMQAAVPVQVGLTGVFFLNAELGWAVGHDHVIIRTRDGGKSWTRIYDNIEVESPLLDVWFRDAENGFAIGAYGAFLTTTDGGDNWKADVLNLVPKVAVEGTDEDNFEDDFIDYHLNQIAESASGKLYIAAEAGHMYRSDDNGQSWVSLSSPYNGSWFGVLPLNGESLLMFGLRGSLYRSDDSGVSWEKLETRTKALLNYGICLPDGTILICGNRATIVVSQDDGHSFKTQRISVRKGITACTLVDDDALIFVGGFGVKKISISDLNL